MNIPGLPGLEILELLRAARPTVPVVVLTASGSETMAVHAFRRGVADYVMKEPGELERLPSVLSSVLKANHFDHIAGPEPGRDLPNGEEFPRRLIDAMPVGIQYLDSGLRVLYHNAVMRQWVGRSYVGETCCHAIWGCDEIYQDCQAARVVQEGRSLESIIEPPLADAQWRALHMFSHPVLNEGEHVTGVVEYLIDISEHVMAKRQVAQSDANWRALTENSPDRILLVGVDGRILFANFRLEEGSENPATGENLYRFLQDAERQRMRDCFSRVLASGHAECYESEYVGGDGQSRFFASTVAPVRRDDRNVALVVNSRDITELRRSLLELRESERFLRSTLNGLLSQIAIVDESGEIVSVNNAWRRFAEANGVAANRVSEGCNYLSVCDRATGEGASDARVVAAECARCCVATGPRWFTNMAVTVRTNNAGSSCGRPVVLATARRE